MKGIIILFIVFCFSCNDLSKPIKDSAAIVISEDSLKQFVKVSSDIPLKNAQEKLDDLIATLKNDSAAFRNAIDFLSMTFSNPNSQYRNENLYIQLLNAKINSSWYIDAEKEVAKNKLHLAQQNRVGKQANDFDYYTPDRMKKRLYDIKAPYTLLYFYNPECHACKEMKVLIDSSKIITENVVSGSLKLLAMYTDRDESLWRRHLPENPRAWINGRDTLEYLWTNKVYDLRAIPTLYLFDEKKRVLIKDGNVEEIESKLRAN